VRTQRNKDILRTLTQLKLKGWAVIIIKKLKINMTDNSIK